MSLQAIRSALETRLAALAPALPTAWENVPFSPPTGAYQKADHLIASTANPTYGGWRDRGTFQVTLCYPLGTGSADLLARAEAVRAQFARGTSLAAGTRSVLVTNTPSVASLGDDGNRVLAAVRVDWQCDGP